jgi:hypothetical protein
MVTNEVVEVGMWQHRFARACGTVILAGWWFSAAQAAEGLQFTLQMRGEQIAGQMREGTRIGEGRLVYDGEHSGFQVWSGAIRSGSSANRYVISGQANDQHQLRIRLEKADWVIDNEAGKGIIWRHGGGRAAFYVLIDGDQHVTADHYLLVLNGAVLLP